MSRAALLEENDLNDDDIVFFCRSERVDIVFDVVERDTIGVG